MAPHWPSGALVATEVMFHPEVPSRSGGMSITGIEQVIASNAGRWRASMSFNIGFGHQATRSAGRAQDTVLAWRAMLAYLQGRTNTFLIGPHGERAMSPAAMAGDDVGPFSIPHSDGSFFSDGSGYDQAATPAEAAAAAAMGATTLTVDMIAGHTPEPGQYFGVGERLYLISGAEETATADRWTLTFWPPLRVALEVGDELNFDNPVCLMRFRDDQVAEFMARGPLFFAAGNLDLVEVPVTS